MGGQVVKLVEEDAHRRGVVAVGEPLAVGEDEGAEGAGRSEGGFYGVRGGAVGAIEAVRHDEVPARVRADVVGQHLFAHVPRPAHVARPAAGGRAGVVKSQVVVLFRMVQAYCQGGILLLHVHLVEVHIAGMAEVGAVRCVWRELDGVGA